MSDRTVISVKNLQAVMEAMPPSQSILIRGRHGIGKSELVFQLGEKIGIPVIDRRLSQMSEGDVIGLPFKEEGSTKFLPPDWFLEACKFPRILFLDEINRATPETSQAAFQIVLSHELNGNKLHPDTRVYAAVNDSSDYQVNEMDPAMLDRFSVYDLEPTLDDWLAWARDNVDAVIVDFIAKNSEHLENTGAIQPGSVYPSRRSWAKVDTALKHAKLAPSDLAGRKTPTVVYNIAQGLLGVPAAAALVNYIEKYQIIFNAEDVLDRWEEVGPQIKGLTTDALNALIHKVGKVFTDVDVTPQQAKNTGEFAKVLPKELLVNLWTAITLGRNTNNIIKIHKEIGMLVVNAANAAREQQGQK